MAIGEDFAGAEDLAELIAEESGEGQGGLDGPEPGPQAPPVPEGCMSLEEFQLAFSGVHKAAGYLFGLESLKAVPDNELTPEAARVLHETCCEVEWLHFAIRRGGKWMERVTVAGMFGMAVYMPAYQEHKAKRREAVEAAKAEKRQAQQQKNAAPAKPYNSQAATAPENDRRQYDAELPPQ